MPQNLLDVKALHAALDQQRQAQHLSWRQLAKKAGVSPSTLTRMAQGKRPDVDSFSALVQWLRIPAEKFMRRTGQEQESDEAEPLAVISTYLRSRRELSPESAEALEDIIKAAYDRLKETE